LIGKIEYTNGNIFDGEFKDGLNHGKGKLEFKESGNIYEGEFYEGFMHGKGKKKF